MLTSSELTGRTAGHVQHMADADCVLHARAAEAFCAMRAAARQEGIELRAVSGFRQFERQLAIWNAKFNGERPVRDGAGALIDVRSLNEAERVRAILMWSALPGASRHHWGTDIDVVDASCITEGSRVELLPEEFGPVGRFARLNGWLESNIRHFHFFRPYAVWRGGVRPEPWHLSYAPVAVPALQAFSLEMLTEAIESADLPGKSAVLSSLPWIFATYVRSVDGP
jgi:LAS superfamily LD-carboxypeptidase LdcB